jgi:predicted cobalt transporter CbtA
MTAGTRSACPATDDCTVTFTHLLRRGVAAGAAAGLAAAVVTWLVVEPVIRRALVIEEARGGHRHGGGGEEPLVSRGLQVLGGVGTSALAGVMFGVLFAVVFAKVRHLLPATTDFGRAGVLAALGFFVFALLPGTRLPANPPAVGDPATVAQRTWLYVLCILLGLLIVSVVATVDRYQRGRGFGVAVRGSVNLLTFVVGVALVFALVPGTPDPVPADVPAGLLWDFRLASLTQLAVMWATLGVSFGLLVQSRTATSSRPDPAPTPV